MLLRYIVSNFKSIGHSIEFSMFPDRENTDERFLRTIMTRAGEWKILQRGGFFGPNASGKSSFIESIDFAVDYIVDGQKSGRGTGVNQFRGDFADLESISSFQFMFYLNGEVYEYGFSLNKSRVYEEWLMQLGEKGLEPLFTRVTGEEGRTEIEIESKFIPEGSPKRELAELLTKSIQVNQKNQLFIYKLYDNGIEEIEDIFNWFKHIQVIFPNSSVQSLPIRMKEDTHLRTYIADKLRTLDTGVWDVVVLSNKIPVEDFVEKYDIPTEVMQDMEKIENGIVNINGKSFIFTDGKLLQIKFNHKLNSKIVKFNIDEESDGTQRLVDLLPMLFAIQENNNYIYFVDEIDRSLHTKLSRFLLEEFVNSGNAGYNQIIFTAHDVSLINLESFRQDEIWFIEKNHLGESRLKPLSNFEIGEGIDALKAYLNGRFGAIPIIRERKNVSTE